MKLSDWEECPECGDRFFLSDPSGKHHHHCRVCKQVQTPGYWHRCCPVCGVCCGPDRDAREDHIEECIRAQHLVVAERLVRPYVVGEAKASLLLLCSRCGFPIRAEVYRTEGGSPYVKAPVGRMRCEQASPAPDEYGLCRGAFRPVRRLSGPVVVEFEPGLEYEARRVETARKVPGDDIWLTVKEGLFAETVRFIDGDTSWSMILLPGGEVAPAAPSGTTFCPVGERSIRSCTEAELEEASRILEARQLEKILQYKRALGRNGERAPPGPLP